MAIYTSLVLLRFWNKRVRLFLNCTLTETFKSYNGGRTRNDLRLNAVVVAFELQMLTSKQVSSGARLMR